MSKKNILMMISTILTAASMIIYLFLGVIESNPGLNPKHITGLQFIFGFHQFVSSTNQHILTGLGFSLPLLFILLFILGAFILELLRLKSITFKHQSIIPTVFKSLSLTLMVLTIVLANYNLPLHSLYPVIKLQEGSLYIGLIGYLSFILLIGSIGIEVFSIRLKNYRK